MADTTVVECPNCGKKNRVQAAASGRPECAVCHHPLPWMVEAGDNDFDTTVSTSSLPVLVDVWAPWCGPCKVMEPALERAARELAGRIKVVRVDADQAPSISARFGVRGIPTLLLLDHGRLVDRQVGALTGAAVRQWTERALSSLSAH